MAEFTTVDMLNLKTSFSAMMNINSNLNELHSFNPSHVHHDLISLSHDGLISDSDQQRSHHQLPFTFSNDQVLNYDPMASFFPPNNTINADCDLVNSSPRVPETGLLGNNNKASVNGNYNNGGKKRKRNSNREALEKPREVVHVRAKRGQATDSHSLAERLRREKINEKLRCLQDLVPGCYKTMGMAVMLDVIINYVRSLQNQIDFLSMKLSAASLFYDFNSSEMDAIGTLQGTNGFEAQGMEKHGTLPQFHTSWPL